MEKAVIRHKDRLWLLKQRPRHLSVAERNSLAYNTAMTVMETEHPGKRDAKAFLPGQTEKETFIAGHFFMQHATIPFPEERHRVEYEDQSI